MMVESEASPSHIIVPQKRWYNNITERQRESLRNDYLYWEEKAFVNFWSKGTAAFISTTILKTFIKKILVVAATILSLERGLLKF